MADARLDASGHVTRLLEAYARGNSQSLNEVVPMVYQELKDLARAQLRRSGLRDRLETTALVHEAYEKLVVGKTQTAHNRHHFFAIASRAMRQIVVDTYRAEHAAKRGGGAVDEPLMTDQLAAVAGPEGVIAFDRAIDRLAAESPELAELLDLSCFGGLSTAEIATLTDTTIRTVQRNLGRARAWVGHFLGDEAG